MNPQEYLTQVLQKNTYSIPIEANYGVYIPNLVEIYRNIKNAEDKISDKNLEIKSEVIASIAESQTKEIFLATSINLPGENVSTSRVGYTVDNNGYGGLLSSPVLKGRRDTNNLEISFIETNISFLDYFIRPWVVAVSQFGLFSKNTNIITASLQNFKTQLEVKFFEKEMSADGQNKPVIRKTFLFNDAVPVEVGGYEAAYGKSVGMRTCKTTWTYSTYKIS